MSSEIELFDRLRKVEMSQGTHEAVCAERYTGILNTHAEIKSDLASTKKALINIGLALLGGMAMIMARLLFH
jgi:hypothetical protein